MKLRYFQFFLLLSSIGYFEVAAQKKSFTRPEERGEDLNGLSNSALFQRLDTVDFTNICAGRPHENPGCVELRKICKVLGDRHLAGTLNMNKNEKQTIYRLVEAYLDYFLKDKIKNDDFFDGFSEAYSQCKRLWGLAYPALMAHVSDKDPDLAQFAVNTLLDMRDEEVYVFFVDLAQNETNWRKRIEWMQLLGFMGEHVNGSAEDDTRAPIDSLRNKMLYEKHARAVFEEFKATMVHPSTRLPCPDYMDSPTENAQPATSTENMQTLGFEDTIFWTRPAWRDVQFILNSSFCTDPALGKTTISIDANNILCFKTIKGNELFESKVKVNDLDVGENGVFLIHPAKPIDYPGFSIKLKPESSEVNLFKNNKHIQNTQELQFYLPDQQHVQWLIEQLLYAIMNAQGVR